VIPDKITIHCSDSKNGDNSIGATQINEWHIARGWKKIGYHLVIKCDGEVERGRSLNEVGAHVESHNEGNIGICLIGTDKYSRAQFDVLRYQIGSLLMNFHAIKSWAIYCHNQWDTAQKQGKTCPNMEINRVLSWLWQNDEDAIDPYLLK